MLCTRKKAKITLACMFVVCTAISTFSFWTIGTVDKYIRKLNTTEPRCFIYQGKLNFYRDWLFIFFGMGELLIPSIAVAFFTGIIIWKLSVAAKERSKTIGPYRPPKTSKESQPTMALLSIAITFVLLRLPYIVAYYINEYKEELWHGISAQARFRIYVAYSLTFVLSTLTYSISFLLFCLTGHTFRKELRKFLTCQLRRTASRRGASYANTTSTSTSVKYDNCNVSESPRPNKRQPDLLNFKKKACPRDV